VRRIVPALAVTDFDAAKALDAVDEADVVVLSLGGYSADNTPLPATASAIHRLQGRLPGCVVVAAAGNDAVDRPFWPAAMKGVIGVAAHDQGGRPAGFSNHGDWVDASAPGEGVVSTYLDFTGNQEPTDTKVAFSGWAKWSGTSFAAPIVAGAIAAGTSLPDVDAKMAAFHLISSSGVTHVASAGTAVVADVATA
jgi:subtilisin family serine protease